MHKSRITKSSRLKKFFAMFVPLSLAFGTADHVIFTRIVITPTNAEMVAIHNPTSESVDLSDYYITDATEHGVVPPEAQFSADVTSGDAPLIVTFTDASTPGTNPITSWHWDFGDGTDTSYVVQAGSLSHAYTTGSFDVTLTVSDWTGLQSTEAKVDYIQSFGDPDFAVKVVATGGETSYDLTIGFSPSATDGYDPGIDSYAPPAPPTGVFNAALSWNSVWYYTQIVNGSSDDLLEHEWEIALQYPGNDSIEISWDNTGWTELGSFTLQDAFGGAMINIDMTDTTGLTLTNPAMTTLKLKVTPNDFSARSTNTFMAMETRSDNLGDYYYKLPSGEKYWSGTVSDFIARFPANTIIEPGDTLFLSLHTAAKFEGSYSFPPDLALFEDMRDAEDGETTISFGSNFQNTDILHDNQEVLILFQWDGSSETVKDVDYFLWGNNSYAIDKTGFGDYFPDTPIEEQSFMYPHGEDSTYVRISTVEAGENSTGGNGMTGHDETSEDLTVSWQVILHPEITYGCMDSQAENYNPEANKDDGSCVYDEDVTSINDVIHNCGDEAGAVLACDGEYDLSTESAGECLFYEESVTTSGVIVDYFDVTVYGGPHSFTIEDNEGYRLDFVVWPEPSTYQNGFDISSHSSLSKLTRPPYGIYEVRITGDLGAYCDDDELLDIYSEWQITVEYDSSITIISEKNYDGHFSQENINSTAINPAPYVMIPELGETLDFTYSHPERSRVIIRIFDLSGRFITSLVDKYVEESGVWYNGVNPDDLTDSPSSAWDGRDHLGQIVPAGTYLMHLETMNPATGETQTDVAPIVVGVKN